MKRGLALFLFVAGCGVGVDEFNEASTQQCPQTTVEGVDVYQGDTPIDWAMVQTSGRMFAFTKASQGNYNKQSNFATNWKELKAQGMVRGAYHYFDATIDGALQAQWFLDQLNAAGGMEPGDMPPALDLECPTSPTQNSTGNMCLGNSKNGWAPTATIIKGVWAWLDAVEAATHRKPIIYSYVSWFASFGFTDPKLTEYPLWVASVASPTCATVPAPWTAATFWQYSSTKHVPGIGSSTATAADQDRFMGTDDQLMMFASNALEEDGGADGMPSEDLGPIDLAASPMPDLSLVDLMTPPSNEDAGKPKGKSSSGCGCELGGVGESGGVWLAILILALIAARRRPRKKLTSSLP